MGTYISNIKTSRKFSVRLREEIWKEINFFFDSVLLDFLIFWKSKKKRRNFHLLGPW